MGQGTNKVVKKTKKMTKKALLTGIALVLLSYWLYYNFNMVQGEGNWVRPQEDCPIDGYILHQGRVYGCFLDDIKDIAMVEPLECVDVESFEICIGTGYARDKHRVYYPILVISADGEDFGYSYFKEYVVKKSLFGFISVNANPSRLKYVKEGYAVDGHTLFLRGKEVGWDFEIVGMPFLISKLFPNKKRIDSILVKDSGQWKHLKNGESYGLYHRIGDSVYGGYAKPISKILKYKPLEAIDINTFEVCKRSNYARDKNHVYCPREIVFDNSGSDNDEDCHFGSEYILKDVTPQSFKFLGNAGKRYAVSGTRMFSDSREITWDNRVIQHFSNHKEYDSSCKYCKENNHGD